MELERPLTDGERAALSPGLWGALLDAGARPRIVGRASLLARAARLWRGQVPILTLGERIFWLDAPADCSTPGSWAHLPTLQHELQHVLDFATGELSLLRYATDPRNWVYRYRLSEGRSWRTYGAEQRASMVEDLWSAERGPHADPHAAAALRRLIPWARDNADPVRGRP